MRAECDVLRGAPRSSRDDPQFVETFYKSSRLHFIGGLRLRVCRWIFCPTRLAAARPGRA